MNIREEYKKSLKMLEVEELLDLILYRPLALVFVRFVYKTPLTPNGVTFLSMLGGLASAYSFAQGTASGMAWGGIWYAIANVFDCSDGQLARLQGSGTPLGRLVDGVVDWFISVAIFAGLAIGLQRSTGDASVWFIVSISGIASAVHAFFFDLYQQQFISIVRGQKNFVDQEVEKVHLHLATSNGSAQRLYKRLVLSIYLRYLEAQRSSRSSELEGRQYPPDLYRAMNKNVMRFWTLLGPTTNRSLLIVAGLLNNAAVFLWPVLTIGNILLVIALVWQRNILRHLDSIVRQQANPAQERAPATV
jgi:phosphatidylglycerophosphate synthase